MISTERKVKKEPKMKRTQVTNDQKDQVPDMKKMRSNTKHPIAVQQSCSSADLPSLRQLLLSNNENSTNLPDPSNDSAKSNSNPRKRKLDKYKDPFIGSDHDSDYSQERQYKKTKIEMNFTHDAVTEGNWRIDPIARMFSDGLENLNSCPRGMTSTSELHKSESSLVSESYKYLANKENRKAAEPTYNRPNLADLQSVRLKELIPLNTSTHKISIENMKQSIFNFKFECSGDKSMSNQELGIPNTNENSFSHFIEDNVDDNFKRCNSSLSLFQASKYGGNISALYNLSTNLSEGDLMHNHSISQLTFNSTFSAQQNNFTKIPSKLWTLESTLYPTTNLSLHNNANFEYPTEPPNNHILDLKCDENCKQLFGNVISPVAQPLQNDWFQPRYIPMEHDSNDIPNFYSSESEDDSLTILKLKISEICESLQDSYSSDQNSLKQRREHLEKTERPIQESDTVDHMSVICLMTLLSNFCCEYDRAYTRDTFINNSSCMETELNN